MIFESKGGCAHQITLAKVDYLVFATHQRLNMFEYLTLEKPDICIMGSGAHLHDDGDMYSVVARLETGLAEFRAQHGNKTKFIWKVRSPYQSHR